MAPPPTAEVDDLPPGTITSGEHAALVAEEGQGSGGRSDGVWRRRVLRVAAAVVLAVLTYLTVTFVQVWRASSRDDPTSADAIVVLGAAQYDGEPSPVLESRLSQALDLYNRGLAPRIVVTGGRRAGDTFTEATSGYNWLRDRGVPDEAILKEVTGRNTFESLAATARFLDADGQAEVLLVSDDYHTLRVEGTAREVGLDPHVSAVSRDGVSFVALGRETVAVSVGRITGYGRLTRLTG